MCATAQLHVAGALRITAEHTGDLHESTSFHLHSNKEMFVLKEHIANVHVSEVCCKCFYIDVAKVDRDISHVVMAKYASCKPMFEVF
jgi:hypothetical protein